MPRYIRYDFIKPTKQLQTSKPFHYFHIPMKAHTSAFFKKNMSPFSIQKKNKDIYISILKENKKTQLSILKQHSCTKQT